MRYLLSDQQALINESLAEMAGSRSDKHTDALANVYAQSLFELATDAGGNEKVLEIADED